jgi:hypothetical protein
MVLQKVSVLMIILITGAAIAEIPLTPGWYEIPNTKIRPVCATTPGISGVEGCSAVIDDWCGATFDTKRNRLILWGGGHNGYYGNELYAINMTDLTATRITEPGLPAASYSDCSEAIANGTQPNSRHTYDNMAYMPNLDKMFTYGGSLACGPSGISHATWIFDFATMTWERKYPAGDTPCEGFSTLGQLVNAVYDPNTEKVFMHDGAHLYKYDPIANTYQRYPNSMKYGCDGPYTAVIDPTRNLFVRIGEGAVYTFDLSLPVPNVTTVELPTTGGSAVTNYGSPGLAYDPVRDKIVAWLDPGNTVYSLDLDTGVWTSVTYPGGPAASRYFNGIWKRWNYSPDLDVFIAVNDVDQNAFAFRFPESTADNRSQLALSSLKLKVFPNPAKSGINIAVSSQLSAVSKINLSVYNVNGKLVKKLIADSRQLKTGINLNTSGLSTGIYILKAQTALKTFSKRLFVQK